MNRVGTIHPPKKPDDVPNYAQWLSGQGAGVWFSIDASNNGYYRIRRFSPSGQLDCDRLFEIEQNGSIFDINLPYRFTHISHCSKCRIIQNEIEFIFNYVTI